MTRCRSILAVACTLAFAWTGAQAQLAPSPDLVDEALVYLGFEASHDVLAGRFRACRGGGAAGILPYVRGGGREGSPGAELTGAIESSEFIRKRFPTLHEALLNYPSSSESLTDSRFYWTKKTVSGRPAFALVLAVNRTFTEKVTGVGRGLKKTMGRKMIAAKFAERFEHLRKQRSPAPG